MCSDISYIDQNHNDHTGNVNEENGDIEIIEGEQSYSGNEKDYSDLVELDNVEDEKALQKLELENKAGDGKNKAKNFNPTQMYLDEIGEIDLLSVDEELQLAQAVVKGDEQARKRMIESNLRLVVKIARHYVSCGMDLSDLIEEGNLGLIIAVEKFKPEMGFRFSTYATWWIRHTVERAIMNQSRTVRIPIHILRELRNYKRKSLELTKGLDHDPTRQELASMMAKPIDKIQKVLDLNQATVSLDNPLSGEQNGSTFADQLEDESNVNPLTSVQDENVRQLVMKLIAHLDLQQQEVLLKRFGLDGSEGMSLEEVAKSMHMSREKVRQIQNNALRRLRNIMLEFGMKNEIMTP